MCKDFDECVLQDDCVHPYVESLIRLELFELADPTIQGQTSLSVIRNPSS
jgi:hypothetical protein